MQNEETKNTETAQAKTEEKKVVAAPAAEKKAAKKASVSKAKAAKKPKVIITSARRKTSIARALLSPGSGRIFFNRMDVNALGDRYKKALILEPVKLSEATVEIANASDISVNVRGGGDSSQTQAARSAIAKAISEASKGDAIKRLYLDYDRALLVDDVRQVEPKKFRGPKARARFQKSYR